MQTVALRSLTSVASRIAEVQQRTAEAPAALTPNSKNFTDWREQRSPLSTPRTLDGGNLPALGRTVWGDYLMGVEIAGTLLLLAAIGAIAINQSPREDAR